MTGRETRVLHGISAAPGIASGPAFVLERQRITGLHNNWLDDVPDTNAANLFEPHAATQETCERIECRRCHKCNHRTEQKRQKVGNPEDSPVEICWSQRQASPYEPANQSMRRRDRYAQPRCHKNRERRPQPYGDKKHRVPHRLVRNQPFSTKGLYQRTCENQGSYRATHLCQSRQHERSAIAHGSGPVYRCCRFEIVICPVRIGEKEGREKK
jgi:hypothetical protein